MPFILFLFCVCCCSFEGLFGYDSVCEELICLFRSVVYNLHVGMVA